MRHKINKIKNEKHMQLTTKQLTKTNKEIQKLDFGNLFYLFIYFNDQMLDRLSGHPHFCFLDGYSGYNQISIAPEEQEKTTFTCPYGTFSFRRMPFLLCNAPTTFQRRMMSMFSNWQRRFLCLFRVLKLFLSVGTNVVKHYTTVGVR